MLFILCGGVYEGGEGEGRRRIQNGRRHLIIASLKLGTVNICPRFERQPFFFAHFPGRCFHKCDTFIAPLLVQLAL